MQLGLTTLLRCKLLVFLHVITSRMQPRVARQISACDMDLPTTFSFKDNYYMIEIYFYKYKYKMLRYCVRVLGHNLN